MKIVTINCNAISQRLKQEGHEVESFGLRLLSNEGKIIVKNFNKLLELNSDLFVCKETGIVADKLRSSGRLVFNDSLMSQALLDSDYNKKVVGVCELPTCDENNVSGFLWNGFNASNWFSIYSYRYVLDGNLGIIDTCSACVFSFCPEQTYFSPVYDLLKKTQFRGFVYYDITGLQFGFVNQYLYAMLEFWKHNTGKMFSDVASGNQPRPLTTSGVSVGVRVSIYPFPPVYPEQGISVEGITEKALKHLWIDGVDESFVTNGSSGELVIATAIGEDVREARRRVYRGISMITIPFPMYRTDVGLNLL